MKNNPDSPGGSLKSKPTWLNAFGCSAMSVFLFSVVQDVWDSGTGGLSVLTVMEVMRWGLPLPLLLVGA